MVVFEICSVEITLLKEINSMNYLKSFSAFFLKSVKIPCLNIRSEFHYVLSEFPCIISAKKKIPFHLHISPQFPVRFHLENPFIVPYLISGWNAILRADSVPQFCPIPGGTFRTKHQILVCSKLKTFANNRFNWLQLPDTIKTL